MGFFLGGFKIFGSGIFFLSPRDFLGFAPLDHPSSQHFVAAYITQFGSVYCLVAKHSTSKSQITRNIGLAALETTFFKLCIHR